ncbi:MAG: SCO family protein [Steroidobacteraceae bacterium]
MLLLAGTAVLTDVTDRFRAFTAETAHRVAVQEHPVPIPAVALETQSGARINLTGFHGKWLLIDFIYTQCADFCVVLGDEFGQLQNSLAAPIAQGRLQLLSISFDPVRDTPTELAAYLERSGGRGAGWIAARPIDANGLARIERVFDLTVIPDHSGGYIHNADIEIVDPQGRLVEIADFGHPRQITRIAQGYLNR